MSVPIGEKIWAEHPDLVRFYLSHRYAEEHLYPSERRFIPWLASRSESVLDVGCAAGGFSNIWRSRNPSITYTGVDLSKSLVDVGRLLHPDIDFHRGDCAAGLGLDSRYADVVQALGWLHWEPAYRDVLLELWRLTRRYLFFDVRIVEGADDHVGGQQVAFSSSWDGHTATPYIGVGWLPFARLLLDLRPSAIFGDGHWGEPAATVMGFDEDVFFGTFVVEKGLSDGEGSTTVCLAALTWPGEVSGGVRIVGSAELETRVPRG